MEDGGVILERISLEFFWPLALCFSRSFQNSILLSVRLTYENIRPDVSVQRVVWGWIGKFLGALALLLFVFSFLATERERNARANIENPLDLGYIDWVSLYLGFPCPARQNWRVTVLGLTFGCYSPHHVSYG